MAYFSHSKKSLAHQSAEAAFWICCFSSSEKAKAYLLASRLHPLEDRKQTDVWEIPRPKRSDEYPTMKPIELVAKAILNSSSEGDLVLDLFGGSGTTILAAEQTSRPCCSMELDPKYVDVIVKRFIKSTGDDAGVFLVRNGKTVSYQPATNT